MKSAAIVFLVIALCLAVNAAAKSAEAPCDQAITSPNTYDIGDSIPEERVAIMDLRVTGDYADQVRFWLPALIEDHLLKEGWNLVVRGDRGKNVQAERTLRDLKPETKLPSNEVLGATVFVELNARVQVKDIQGIIGYKAFTFGDYARAVVDINGQVVDPATGVLKSSVNVGGSASGLKASVVFTIAKDWRVGALGYNLKGIRESLVGKAADTAACRMVQKLKLLYPTMPGQTRASKTPNARMQPSSTTVALQSTAPTILLSLPSDHDAKPADRYGIYRDETQIAEVQIIRVAGNRAEARILSQKEAIKPTDVARKAPLMIMAE